MATYTFSGGNGVGGFDTFLWTAADILNIVANTFSTSHSATQVTYNDGFGEILVINGTFTGFDASGDPTGGTVTSFSYTTSRFQFTAGGPMTISGSGLSLSVPTLINWVATNNAAALQSALFDSADTFTGSNGGDVIFGHGGADTLNGGLGNDTLIGGAGNDALNGGLGDDRLVSADTDTIDGGDGIDFVDLNRSGSALSYAINAADLASAAGATLADGTTIKNTERFAIVTGSGADVLTVVGALPVGPSFLDVNTFNGGAGVDRLVGDFSATSVAIQSFLTWTNVEELQIQAGTGNDTINGGSGNDNISGGGGDDAISGGTGGIDTLDGGAGNDLLQLDLSASGINQTLSIAAFKTAVGGSLANGSLIKNMERFELTTGAGADTFDMTGLAGANALHGGGGNDRLVVDLSLSTENIGLLNSGSTGVLSGPSFSLSLDSIEAYTVSTGAGNDVLSGGAGNDVLTGGGGADTLRGLGGANTLLGGDGDDVIQGSSLDTIDGGAGTDRLEFDASGQTTDVGVTVTPASFTLTGATVNVSNVEVVDAFIGGSGNDTFQVAGFSNGSFSFTGGAGNDTFQIADFSTGTFSFIGGAGTDELVADLSNIIDRITIFPSFSAPGISGSGPSISFGASEIERVNITTGAGNDHLVGLAGRDILNGGGGSNVFGIATGGDTLIGGSGFDTFDGFDAGSTIDGGAGTDFVRLVAASSVTPVVFNVAQYRTAAGGDFAGSHISNVESFLTTGGAGDDTFNFLGLVGGNFAECGGGVDRVNADLSGSPGAISISPDQFGVNVGGSTGSLRFFDAEIVSVVGSAFEDFMLGINGVNIFSGGAGNDSLTGNSGDDAITGGADSDTLAGLGGNDTLDGGEGADALDGGAGADALIGGTGNDTYVVDTDIDI
ncbi:MAG TPA: hypothetical protein DHW63_06505, partial [Hyphomonadaceae bacterium]|nr:hypothetical protein [Hyphomonadaceae bacterium]